MASNETAPVEKKEKLEPQIKSVDMSDDMQQEAIEVAQEAMEKYNIEKDIAMHIKREFDGRKGATWHCIVGRNFGSFVTHDFTSALKGYESITAQCHNCGNWSAHCISSWEWFTICWIPLIPLDSDKICETGQMSRARSMAEEEGLQRVAKADRLKVGAEVLSRTNSSRIIIKVQVFDTTMAIKAPLSEGFGYGIVLGLGFAFALGMIFTTWALKRYHNELQTSEAFSTAGRLKRRAPNAHTFLEVIRARYGTITHMVFLTFGLMTNILVTAMLLTGGSAVVTSLTGVPTAAACFLLPVGVVLYTMFGGIKATFLTDYVHTVMILIIIFVFAFTAYATSDIAGSPAKVWELLVAASERHPVSGNAEGSYLTMRSKEGAIFFVINIVGNFGTVFLDNGYYNKAIAASPVDALPGYVMGGLSWFAIPWLCATTMGLSALALENNPAFPTYPDRIPHEDVTAGLVLPYAAVALLGKGGAAATLLLVFMAVTSASSAELIAVSSIWTYDIYQTYINPKASGIFLIRMSHASCIGYAIIMAGFSTGLHYAGVGMGYLYLLMGCIISSAVLPATLALMWKDQNWVAAAGAPVLGFIVALVAWLVTAKKECGVLNVDCTGSNNPMLAGNVAALLSPLVFVPLLTFAFGRQNYDWESMRQIRKGDDTEIVRRASVDHEIVLDQVNTSQSQEQEQMEQKKLMKAALLARSLTLDVLGIGNVKDPKRLYAHASVAWLFFGFVSFVVTRERIFAIHLRQAHASIKQNAQRPSSRTVLFLGVPHRLLDQASLQKNFGSAAVRAWIVPKAGKLQKLVDRRAGVIDSLETAEVKLEQNVAKHADGYDDGAGSNGRFQRIADVTMFKNRNPRPSHRQNLMGRTVDSISLYRDELTDVVSAIQSLRTSRVEHARDGCQALFVEYTSQEAAYHAYLQVHDRSPFALQPRYTNVQPREVLWPNLNITSGMRIAYTYLSVAAVAVTILFWSIPIGFAATLSNVDYLANKYEWLRWINKLPSPILGFLKGFVPPFVVSSVVSYVPLFFRYLARMHQPTTVEAENLVQSWYMAFQIIQVFLLTTFTSGATALAQKIANDPTSLPQRLAKNLPTASSFYLSYFIVQGVGTAPKDVVNLWDLLTYIFSQRIFDYTPRQKYVRGTWMKGIGWGAKYPKFANFGVIALAYACISPLVLGFAAAGLVLFYISTKYNLVYRIQVKVEPRGANYSRALKHLMVGVYLAELCLLGYCTLKEATGPVILMIALVVSTGIYQFTVDKYLDPIEKFLPLETLELDAEASPFVGSSNGGQFNLLDPLATFFWPAVFTQEPGLRPWLKAAWDDVDVPEYGEDELENAYANPALTSKTPKLWIPRDPSGVSKREIEENGAAGLATTDEGADLDDKGRVWWDQDDFTRAPIFKCQAQQMSVRVQLDQDPSAPYTNLDFISGRVLLALPSDATISAINVKLEAESRTRLMAPRQPHERADRKRAELEVHKLLYLVQTVFPSPEMQDGPGNSQYTLPAGQYAYPFRFKFPINNDCSKSPSLLNDLTLGMARVQFRHVKKTLPPSLAGFPGLADIKYYVKVTVVRPKFYQENLRNRLDIRFMPVEDPRPPDRHEETFARRKQQFQRMPRPPDKKGLFRKVSPSAAGTQQEPPTLQVDARLPSPAIITCHEPLPLRVLVQKLGDSDATIVLSTFQIELIAYTDVRAHDLTRTEVGSWVLVSRANLNTPLDNPNDKSQNEWKLPSSLWNSIPLPDSVAPSFDTCNLSRQYKLDIRVGLSYADAGGVRPELVVLPLSLPVKVYSGIRPPPELLGRIASQPQRQHAAAIFPRPSQQIPNNGNHPDPDMSSTPIHDHSGQPVLTGSQLPPQLGIPDEAPPSYEDAMAEDLAPVDGPRPHYNVSKTEQPPAFNQDTKSGLNREESERLFSSTGSTNPRGSAAAVATSPSPIRERDSGNLIDLDDDDRPAPDLPTRVGTRMRDIPGDENSSPSGLCAAKTILECDGARINLRLVDGNKTLGGVWAQENLYPGLRTNNLRGTIDFADFPMHDGFGVPEGKQVPAEVMHEYLKQYAQKWDLLRRISFETFVEEITRLDSREGWNVRVKNANGQSQDLQTRKLVVATGVSHRPHRPQLPDAEKFEAPIIHSAEMGKQAGAILNDPDVKVVALLGGAKSAYDAAHMAATAGKQVEWIIRKSGKGPCWVFPPFEKVGPFKVWKEMLPVRRIISCLSPCFWEDGFGWIRSFFHFTGIGKRITQAFWRQVHAATLHDCQYEGGNKELSVLTPEQSPFWYGTATGVYNYNPDLFDFIRSGQVRVHREDIKALAPHKILLANGTRLDSDALITATGFSAKPTLEFSPPSLHSDLGVPTTSYSEAQRDLWRYLNHKSELTIAAKYPRLLTGPFQAPESTVVQPYNPGIDPELQYTAYRLYRAIAPPGLTVQGDRSLVFIGMFGGSVAGTMRLELQCLWAYAYLNGKLTINTDHVFDETALMARYCRYRAPFGHGRFYPDLVFDLLPYFDMLVRDLGLRTWRKSNILSELFSPYRQADYRGIVREWLKSRERKEGREITSRPPVTKTKQSDVVWEEQKVGLLKCASAPRPLSAVKYRLQDDSLGPDSPPGSPTGDTLRFNEGLTRAINQATPVTRQSAASDDQDTYSSFHDTGSDAAQSQDSLDETDLTFDMGDKVAFDDTIGDLSTISAIPTDLTRFASLRNSPTKPQRSDGWSPSKKQHHRASILNSPGAAQRPLQLLCRTNSTVEDDEPTPKRQLSFNDSPTDLLNFTAQSNALTHPPGSAPRTMRRNPSGRGAFPIRVNPSPTHRSQASLDRERASGRSPQKTELATPAHHRHSMYAMNGLGTDLLDIDLEPMATPRSIPSITPRELESLRSELQSRISGLEATLSGKEAEVLALKRAITDAEVRAGKFSEELRTERAAREEMEQSRDDLERRSRDMEGVLREIKQSAFVEEREKDKLRRQVDEAERKFEESEVKILELTASLDTLRSDRIKSSPSPAKNADPSTPGVVADIDLAVKNATESVARELHALYKTKHERKVADLKVSYEKRWLKQVDQLRSELKASQDEVLRLQTEREATLSGVIPGQSEALSRMEGQIEELRRWNDELTAQKKVAEAEGAGWKGQAESLTAETEYLRRDLQRERVEKGDLVAQIDEFLALKAEEEAILAERARTQAQLQQPVSPPRSEDGTSSRSRPTRAGSTASPGKYRNSMGGEMSVRNSGVGRPRPMSMLQAPKGGKFSGIPAPGSGLKPPVGSVARGGAGAGAYIGRSGGLMEGLSRMGGR
ncbi:hypothetical protein DV737_g4866, partial [Chaetothyriales sp. CBS 132003]